MSQIVEYSADLRGSVAESGAVYGRLDPPEAAVSGHENGHESIAAG